MGKWLAGIVMGMMLSVQLFAVNINTATADELSKLKGIGESTAAKIVEYRQHNKFTTIEDLMKVKGIGQKKFEAIKSELSV